MVKKFDYFGIFSVKYLIDRKSLFHFRLTFDQKWSIYWCQRPIKVVIEPIFHHFCKNSQKWENMSCFEVFSCKSCISSKIWDLKTSKSKKSQIRKNNIVKISKINFHIYRITPKKFGPNRRSGTHFLKSLLFGQNSLVFSNFLKIFTYKA